MHDCDAVRSQYPRQGDESRHKGLLIEASAGDYTPVDMVCPIRRDPTLSSVNGSDMGGGKEMEEETGGPDRVTRLVLS
jgi:hypothetical protein